MSNDAPPRCSTRENSHPPYRALANSDGHADDSPVALPAFHHKHMVITACGHQGGFGYGYRLTFPGAETDVHGQPLFEYVVIVRQQGAHDHGAGYRVDTVVDTVHLASEHLIAQGAASGLNGQTDS